MKKMKTNQFLVILMAVFFTATLNTQAQDKKATDEQVKFNVNMTCQSCVNKIEKNIAFEKGVKKMNVDLASKTVTLTYDPKRTDVQKLQSGFSKVGFLATVASEKADKPCCSTKTAAAPAPCGDKKEAGCSATADKKACGDKKEGCCSATADKKACGDKKEGCCSSKTAAAPAACGDKKEAGCSATADKKACGDKKEGCCSRKKDVAHRKLLLHPLLAEIRKKQDAQQQLIKKLVVTRKKDVAHRKLLLHPLLVEIRKKQDAQQQLTKKLVVTRKKDVAHRKLLLHPLLAEIKKKHPAQ
jgi:periplasmic mercuric ion binding protein